MLIPKPTLPAGPADPLNAKGDEVVLPNTELLVPLLVVWVVAPKPQVVGAPKEETAVVLPKAGWVLAGWGRGCWASKGKGAAEAGGQGWLGHPRLLPVSGPERGLRGGSGIGWDGGPGAGTKGNVAGWGGGAAECQGRRALGDGGGGREGATEAGGAAARSCLDDAGQGLTEGDGGAWDRPGL
ncbi:hypothetical protein MC885_009587 [Smutsia gigantea]|nr:hypothetical protein MC885_009587 [Smutsia gigantea]